MSSDLPPSGPPGSPGRKRTGPTIDLEATEVASTAPGRSSSEEPAKDSTGSDSNRGAPPPGPGAPKARGSLWRTAAFSAAVIVVAMVVGLAASRFIGGGSDSGSGAATSALEERLARVERQLRDLAGRTPPPAVDPKVVDDLVSRVAKLE